MQNIVLAIGELHAGHFEGYYSKSDLDIPDLSLIKPLPTVIVNRPCLSFITRPLVVQYVEVLFNQSINQSINHDF